MRKNSQRIIAGALMLTVLVSTGCSVQNSQQTVTEQQTQQSTTSETEPETGAPVADTDETTDGVVNYGMMEDTSIKEFNNSVSAFNDIKYFRFQSTVAECYYIAGFSLFARICKYFPCIKIFTNQKNIQGRFRPLL